MYLDIAAYEKVTYLRGVGEYSVTHPAPGPETFLYVHPLSRSQADGMKTGIYRIDGAFSTTFRRVGTESWFSDWLSWLAKVHGENPIPFFELITFINPGIIGPKTSEKLYNDFVKFDSTARNNARSEYDYIAYQWFKQAFGIARHGGCVEFRWNGGQRT